MRKFEVCGLAPAETLFPDFEDGCPNWCEANCVAQATCDELAPEKGDTGWARSNAEACLDACIADHTIDPDTPLALVWDARPVRFVPTVAPFDFGRHVAVTDRPLAPWLALDRNGNGRIDDGTDLFGDATPLADGGTAPHGFSALAELDADGDGWVSEADPGWSALRAWSDDGDWRSSSSELAPLPPGAALSVHFVSDPRCDARGNCEQERASIRWDGRPKAPLGVVVDVHLVVRAVLPPAGI